MEEKTEGGTRIGIGIQEPLRGPLPTLLQHLLLRPGLRFEILLHDKLDHVVRRAGHVHAARHGREHRQHDRHDEQGVRPAGGGGAGHVGAEVCGGGLGGGWLGVGGRGGERTWLGTYCLGFEDGCEGGREGGLSLSNRERGWAGIERGHEGEKLGWCRVLQTGL